MIVIVLFTMLLLAAILYASTQLSLSAARTTTDQRGALSAQYVAESNLNVARSQLRSLSQLLSPKFKTPNGEIPSIQIKLGTPVNDVESLIQQLCGTNTPIDNWSTLPGFQPKPGEKMTNGQVYTDNYARVCQGPSGRIEPNGQTNQFALLGTYILPEAYSVALPANERPDNLMTVAGRTAFWQSLFTGTNNKFTRNGSRLQLDLVQIIKYVPRTGGVAYRFVIRTRNLSARGVQGNAARFLKSTNNTSDRQTWYFEIKLSSLLKNVLQTNFHRSQGAATPNINFTSQVFNGPVHTNEKFVFANNATASFNGPLSSAGCTNLADAPTSSTSTSNWSCNQMRGYYLAGNIRTAPASMSDRQANNALNADLKSNTTASIDDPVPEADYAPNNVNFAADYIALPDNANDQKAKAIEGGITVPTNATGLQLFAGDANGNALTSYDSSKTRWNEPSNTYQYIRFYPTQEQCIYGTVGWEKTDHTTYYKTPSAYRTRDYHNYYRRPVVCDSNLGDTPVVEYRVDSQGNLFKKSGTSWSSTGRKFNGVIFGDTISTVMGPPRLSNISNPTGQEVLNNAPPALASFSKITIAAQKSVGIGSDLTMSDAPCRQEDTDCKKYPYPANMLGIFSQEGNVSIAGNGPADIKIHAALMSSKGEVNVNGYDAISQRGRVHLRGSLVENWYGAFGTFNPNNNTDISGYGRNFTYDRRFREGNAPPYWPVSPSWSSADARERARLEDVTVQQGTAGDF
ncbi:hypothetical protein [Deinococcus sp. Marseille-Q6407]|uniref:hypothetical protein n=1 Tax=Deinococcus sp. Marseille-Q6407 TaxID=2969223 RepID=UPI0021BFDAA1|nr:hypothetical protein [Deinococcus sp. Marseille-Q6407]